MNTTSISVLCVLLALTVGACGGDDAGGEGTTRGDATAGPAAPPAPPEAANPLSTPRGSLEHQLALLVAGDADALRAAFTPRLRDRITPEAVAAAQEEAASMTMEDLWADATEGTFDGHKTVKVEMRNGRTLTTLVETDGRWLADTIWFR